MGFQLEQVGLPPLRLVQPSFTSTALEFTKGLDLKQPQFISLHAHVPRDLRGHDMVLYDNLCFVHGIIPDDLSNPKTPLPENIEDQTTRVIKNLKTIAAQQGLGLQHVLTLKVYLVNITRFYDRFEKTYSNLFSAEVSPTRSVIGVEGLERGALISMDFTLFKDH